MQVAICKLPDRAPVTILCQDFLLGCREENTQSYKLHCRTMLAALLVCADCRMFLELVMSPAKNSEMLSLFTIGGYSGTEMRGQIAISERTAFVRSFSFSLKGL